MSCCSQDEALEILHQLQRILHLDPLIDEVGFIHPTQLMMLKEETEAAPSSSSSSEQFSANNTLDGNAKNAFLWSREEHKLGISTAYVLPLYKVAKTTFMEALTSYRNHNENENENSHQDGVSLSEIEEEVMKHSLVLVLLSSDFGTAWNARKLVMSRKEDSLILDELRVSALVLSFAPKSEQAWNHRRWVIKRAADSCANLEEILEKESKLVEKIAENSKMNYRAWNHRCWIIPYMTSQQLLHELNINRKWAALHIADSSCFHYRRKLMLHIRVEEDHAKGVVERSSQFESLQQLWKEELDWNESLIRRFIGREALWLHRRFLSIFWVRHIGADHRDTALHSPEKPGNNAHVSPFLETELCLLQDCFSIPDNLFEDVQSQAIHSASYILWLYWEVLSLNIYPSQKLGISDMRILLNKLCPERIELWDHLLTKLSF